MRNCVGGAAERQGRDAVADDGGKVAALRASGRGREEEAGQGVDGGDGRVVVGVAERGGEEGGQDGVDEGEAGGGDGIEGLSVHMVEFV